MAPRRLWSRTGQPRPSPASGRPPGVGPVRSGRVRGRHDHLPVRIVEQQEAAGAQGHDLSRFAERQPIGLGGQCTRRHADPAGVDQPRQRRHLGAVGHQDRQPLLGLLRRSPRRRHRSLQRPVHRPGLGHLSDGAVLARVEPDLLRPHQGTGFELVGSRCARPRGDQGVGQQAVPAGGAVAHEGQHRGAQVEHCGHGGRRHQRQAHHVGVTVGAVARRSRRQDHDVQGVSGEPVDGLRAQVEDLPAVLLGRRVVLRPLQHRVRPLLEPGRAVFTRSGRPDADQQLHAHRSRRPHRLS